MTLEDLKTAIEQVQKITMHDARKKIEDEKLKEAFEKTGNISYPSKYHVATLLDITIKELDYLFETDVDVKYMMTKYEEFCVQYLKEQAVRKGANALIANFMKEDYQIGADDKELVKITMIDPEKDTNHDDDISEYDEVEKEFDELEADDAKKI